MNPRSIVLLPGLGANARLFGPQLEAFGDRHDAPKILQTFVPSWPDPIEPGRGVEGVAKSLARSCVTDRRRPERLGGGLQRGGRSRRFPNESSMQPDDAGGRLRASKSRSIRQTGPRDLQA
ncbi:MAG: hypothetical protein ACYTFH_04680, partial [Planctomycetota bacterium]